MSELTELFELSPWEIEGDPEDVARLRGIIKQAESEWSKSEWSKIIETIIIDNLIDFDGELVREGAFYELLRGED